MDENETPQEVTPEQPVTEVPAVDSVPGSKDDATLATGEHTSVLQPEAPVSSLATAAPAQDAVTINSHLSKVTTDLRSVVEYIQSFLANHEASKVVDDLESVIENIKSLVK